MKFFIKFFSFPFRKIAKNAKKTTSNPHKNRKHVGKNLFFLAIAVFTIFIFRFVWLITVNKVGGVDLKAMATANHQTTVPVYAKRGTIYDRNGAPLAVDSSDYTIYVVLDKKQTDKSGNKLYVDSNNFDKLTTFLNAQLGIDKAEITKQLNQKDKVQVEFGEKGRHISVTKMQEIEKEAKKQNLAGIGFIPSPNRSYVNSSFDSHFIGIAGPKDGDASQGLSGRTGLELAFNDVLSGKNGIETYQKDNQGRPLPGSTKVEQQVKNGQDVYTTLDVSLQKQLESLMDTAVKNSGGQELSATLMDAHTGDILATTQRPMYTDKTINTAEKQKYFSWNSLLYQTAFEPGSTMKTFLMASAIDSNKVNLNTTYERRLQVYDKTINDWDWNKYGYYSLPNVVTVSQGFMMSSNSVMSKVEQGMGYPLWESYLKRFKFDTRVRFGMDGEQVGQFPADDPFSQTTSAFGQGISVNQSQLLRAWTSFANGGAMIEPHVVSKVVDTDKKTSLQNKPEIVGHPVSQNAVDQVRNLMLGVNTDSTFGTTYIAQPFQEIPAGPVYTVNGKPAAAKSGTAQIASSKGGYLEGMLDNLNSAVVMWPPENPDFIFYMTIKIPENSASTMIIGQVANPLLTQAEKLKNEITQVSAQKSTGKVEIDNLKGKEAGQTADLLRQKVLQPVIIGAGSKITGQSIQAGSSVEANTRILLLTDGDKIMPDMFSWTKEQVDQFAKWYDLKITYQGKGSKVTAQSVISASAIKSGQKITVTMG